LLDTLRIRRQLADAPGLVSYALKADLARKTFWTYSVWADESSLAAFAATDPHRQIVVRLQPLMGSTRFSTNRILGADLPTTWDEMTAPLEAASTDGARS
jgi:quinol monooxygenase YgiN